MFEMLNNGFIVLVNFTDRRTLLWMNWTRWWSIWKAERLSWCWKWAVWVNFRVFENGVLHAYIFAIHCISWQLVVDGRGRGGGSCHWLPVNLPFYTGLQKWKSHCAENASCNPVEMSWPMNPVVFWVAERVRFLLPNLFFSAISKLLLFLKFEKGPQKLAKSRVFCCLFNFGRLYLGNEKS